MSDYEFEQSILKQAEIQTQQARLEHQLALKKLGDAKKQERKIKLMSNKSMKLRSALNRSNGINNLSTIQSLHNDAVKAGIPDYYGPVFRSKATPVGRAKEVIDAHQKMMSISKSIKNPSRAKTLQRSVGRMLGVSNHKSSVRNNRLRLEKAYERCEELGICDRMDEIFDQLADLEDERTNAEKERNEKTRMLMSSLPPQQLIKKHSNKMLHRYRHQPERISNKVFQRRNGLLRAHSIANSNNARNMYNNNTARQKVPGHQGNLPMFVLKRTNSKKNKKNKRKTRSV